MLYNAPCSCAGTFQGLRKPRWYWRRYHETRVLIGRLVYRTSGTPIKRVALLHTDAASASVGQYQYADSTTPDHGSAHSPESGPALQHGRGVLPAGNASRRRAFSGSFPLRHTAHRTYL